MPSFSPGPTNNTTHRVTLSSHHRHEATGDRRSRQHPCTHHRHHQGASLRPQPRQHHRPPSFSSRQLRLRSDAKMANASVVMSHMCRDIRSTANNCLSSKWWQRKMWMSRTPTASSPPSPCMPSSAYTLDRATRCKSTSSSMAPNCGLYSISGRPTTSSTRRRRPGRA
jgi:hypothetical protein